MKVPISPAPLHTPAVNRCLHKQLNGLYTWAAHIWRNRKDMRCDYSVISARAFGTRALARSDMNWVLSQLGLDKAKAP